MSEIDRIANRVNKDIDNIDNIDELEDTDLLDADIEDDDLEEVNEIERMVGIGQTGVSTGNIKADETELNMLDWDKLGDILDVTEDGLTELEVIDELDLDVGNIRTEIITGDENERIEMDEREVTAIVNYINNKIDNYNCTVEALNELSKMKYNQITEHNSTIELKQTLRSGGGTCTRDNCKMIEQLIKELKDPRYTLSLQMVIGRLSIVSNEILTDLWKLIEKYEEEEDGSDDEDGLIKRKLVGKIRVEVTAEVEKILGLIKPIVETIEKSIHTKDTSQTKTLNELGRLNKKMESIGNIDAFYQVVNITEVTDGSTTISETRDYLEITAELGRIMDGNLTRKETKKYKDRIIVRVPALAEGVTMELLTTKFDAVKNNYEERCRESNLTPETYILKPFALKYKDALISFGSIGDFELFITNARPLLDVLRDRRHSSKDLTVSISANKENFSGMYLDRYDVNRKEFTRYSEREISKMLEGKQIWKGLDEYIKMPLPFRRDKATLHQYDTPCRRFLLGVLKEYSNSPDVDKTYYDNRVDILRDYLPIIMPYLSNHSKHMLGMVDNPEKGISITYSIASDMITYGAPATGFISRFMTIKDTDELITLQELLDNEEILERIEFSDLLGIDRSFYNPANANRNVTFSPNRLSELATTIISSFKSLCRIDMGTIRSRKEKPKVHNEVIILNRIENERDHLNYLTGIAKSIAKSKKLDENIDIDIIVREYRSRIQPIKNTTPTDNAYYMQQRIGVSEGRSEYQGEHSEFQIALEELNRDRILNDMSVEDFKDAIKGDELSRILGNNIFNEVEITNSGFINDLMSTCITAPLLNNAVDLLQQYLSILTEDMIETYKAGTMQELIGLPGPTPVEPMTDSQYSLAGLKDIKSYDVSELLKGYKSGEYPMTMVRDMIMLDKILSNERIQERLNGSSSERMATRTLGNVLDALLTFSPLPEIKVGRWDTRVLERYVEQILIQICPSNIEYALIKSNMTMKLFYQNINTASNVVEGQLKDYFVEKNELFNDVVNYQLLMYWLDITEVLPIDIYLEVKSDRDKAFLQLKATLEKRPIMMESPRELDMKKKRSNAYYKLFLDTGDNKYLKDVDRNYVDFELLTRQPMADGSAAGEFSTTELIEQYGLEDEMENSLADTPYVDIILLIERKEPRIKDMLPEPIIRFIENDTTVSILDEGVIDALRKDTSFNLNYKTY